MTRIYLIRPCATDFDEQGRIQGNLDIPLSERGALDVARVAAALSGEGLEIVFHSPCSAALQTAEAIALALDVKCKRLDNLQNLSHGLWQGMRVAEVKKNQPRLYRQWQEHPEALCPPEGEMLADAEKRIEPVLQKLLKKHKDVAAIGLVVPEPLASIVRRRLTQAELGDLWKANEEPGRWDRLEVGREPVATNP